MALPQQCVTLSISPMVRETILHLADTPLDYPRDGHADRLARVLLGELVRMPAERLYVPVSDHPKIRGWPMRCPRIPPTAAPSPNGPGGWRWESAR
ncbi:hypothetical protein SAMN04487939_1011006 [Lysobacter sp. yr284]|uniref:hypothetical protein n=1 Tax=Lysobacter sp. yr284 TaxID=1761791 RepID=UPI000897C509|nr:hypothetical protein [Lysobacter sp. yr284]SDY35768.1 hypothetical protein SAMN04487939_1011006 [Lysobacter sp. yr284]